MAKRKTLQAKLADLISDYGLDAVVQAMMMAEQLGRPPKQPKRIKEKLGDTFYQHTLEKAKVEG